MTFTASENSILPARFYHLSVMSECDAECKLCATLGCLRPAKISSPEFRRELDLARRQLKSTIVFSPNFLHHPEASQFVAETIARDFKVIVRLRPEQLVLFSELIATLEYRGANFEVIVSEPLPSKVLSRRSGRAFPIFSTVFVPTRGFDPVLLLESLPLSWRHDVQILAPLTEMQAEALSEDELFLFMTSLASDRRVRPYAELDRRTRGFIPGSEVANDPIRFTYRALAAHDESIRLSVVFTVSAATDIAAIERQLAALKSQTYARQKFEVLLALDRVSFETTERLSTWARESGLTIQGLELAQGFGDLPLRQSQAWNLASIYARGSMLLFLDSRVPTIELLATVVRELETNRLVTIPNASLTTPSCAFALTLRHYFEVAGFAEALQHTGSELAFLIWKSSRIGVLPLELKFESPEIKSTSSVTLNRKHSASAREFYICTLNPDVFEKNFALLGRAFQTRRAFRLIANLGLIQTVQNAFLALRTGLDRQRFAAAVRKVAP